MYASYHNILLDILLDEVVPGVSAEDVVEDDSVAEDICWHLQSIFKEL